MECRARWAFGKGNNGKLRLLRSETKTETDHDSTEQNEHTVRQGQANSRIPAGGKQKERAGVMEGKLNGFIEYEGERIDLKECKHIIAAVTTDDKVWGVVFGELKTIEMAQAIYVLNKTTEEFLESTPGLREAMEFAEVFQNETQD